MAEDATALARYAAAADRELATLPAVPQRDRRQRDAAARILRAARTLRDRFIAQHAEAVYDELTGARSVHLRIDALARAAADRFPGLVPTRAQLDAERALAQADKEGREIDQGILFRGLLRSPTAGPHLTDAMLLPTRRALDLLSSFRRTGRLDLGVVLIERRGAAAHLTLRNTHCLNAEDDALVDDLETAVDLTLLDDQVTVGVLRGGEMTHPRHAGRRVFSAGINLTDLREGRISFVDFLLRRELGPIGKITRGLLPVPGVESFPHRTVQKPWIGAVDSFAIGGGMQLLLVLDRVIATEDAYFSLPAAQEGIVPGVANLRLPRLTGARAARRVILTGQVVTATDPQASLICDEVVPSDGMDAAVETAVAAFDNPAVLANRRMLQLAEEPPERFQAYLAEFAVTQALRLYSEDVIGRIARPRPEGDGRADDRPA
ncbi:(3,5-dihydroxyphenyl)acetyl-CoA 1,2-dioxygenase DpgC [Streptomyces sp. NPDC060223]|uniref:(3,5-dihydroxyphenyl)acetyl-CoA 1,2-dioxygenase DpgC n=1 Tax=unclassified Streptomyces TaxID=2593676 RepID=UPI00363D0E0E